MIYTFYSFKGGVGRSMALANLAHLFYSEGLKVLMVDFDLEAPGLERFFDSPSDVLEQRGVIDMVISFKALRSLAVETKSNPQDTGSILVPNPFEHPVEPLANFIFPIYPSGNKGGALYLIPAGRRAGEEYANYTERVRTFDWDDFYINWEGETFFDWFRREAKSIADVVLVDSRTGITEMTGICTYHLADFVVMLVAPNRQNIEGTQLIAESLERRKQSSTNTGRPSQEILIVPSRVDTNESDPLKQIKNEFDFKLARFISSRLTFENNAFDDLKIPYVARYAFFEKLSISEPDQSAAAEMNAAYHRLASAMWKLAPTSSLFYRRYYQVLSGLPILSASMTLPPPVENFAGRGWVFDQLSNWLEFENTGSFLILGEPGSGKTALARRLVQMSDGDVAVENYPALGAGAIHYAHFCSMHDSSTLDPLHFVRNLARQLAQRYPDFSAALAQSILGSNDVKIDVRQSIGGFEQGARVVGVHIESLELNSEISLPRAFDQLIQQPIKRLYDALLAKPVIILVDGIEQASVNTSNGNILSILALFSNLPNQVRLIVTSRPDPTVQSIFTNATVENISQHQSLLDTDISSYAEKILLEFDPKKREEIIPKVVYASQGNFLFASLLLKRIQAQPEGGDWDETGEFKMDLQGFFLADLQSYVGLDKKRWQEIGQPLLGVLAVALAPLSERQLAGITGKSGSILNEALSTWSMYLEITPLEDGQPGYHLFHNAFRDFLLDNPTYPVFPAEANLAIGNYFYEEWAGRWTNAETYALQHTVEHLIQAVRRIEQRNQPQKSINMITNILGDLNYQQAKIARFGESEFIQELKTAQTVIPSSHPVFHALQDRLRVLEAGPKELGQERVINTEIENHHPDEPLEQGGVYTMAISITEPPAIGIELVPAKLDDPSLSSDTVEISINLFSEDFELYVNQQVLRVPRNARARGKVRFDISPMREGRCKVTALITARGNFIQAIQYDFSVGAQKSDESAQPQMSVFGRSLDSAFTLKPRDLIFTFLQASGGYKTLLAGMETGSGFMPRSPQEIESLSQSAIESIVIDLDWPQLQKGLELTPELGSNTLKRIAEVGYRLSQALFFDPKTDAQMNRMARKLGEITRQSRISLTVIAQELWLPWNLLVLKDLPDQSSPESFFGFQTLLEIILSSPQISVVDTRLEMDRGLRIDVITNPKIEAKKNSSFSVRLMDDFKARGDIIPNLITSNEQLVQALNNPGDVEQIVVITCPVVGDAESSDKFNFELEDGLFDIFQLLSSGSEPLPAKPLFLLFPSNSEAYYQSKTLLLGSLQNAGGRGIVGAEIDLPEIFKLEWFHRFFDLFLSGKSLGEALLELRLKFYSEFNNPLGLLIYNACDVDTSRG